MTALAIASTTGSHFVLQPTRPPFDAGHEVFGGRCDKIGVDRSTTPDALCAITTNDECQSRFPVHFEARRQFSEVSYRFSSMSATRKASSRLCSRFRRGSQAVS